MRFIQFVVATTLLAVCSSQLLPGYFSRKQMTDSALYKFLSAVRGGGRGHRELLSITGSGSSPPASFQAVPYPSPAFGVGRHPHGITHIPPPPKIGAFYITPPERNAPFYYSGPPHGGRRPQLFRITDLKQGRPMKLVTAESSNQPGGSQPPVPVQFFQLNGPVASASNNSPLPSGVPGGLPLGPNSFQQIPVSAGSSSSSAGSLQEIIAQAAQKQHAAVLQKEQKANPNAQITNSQILVPGANVGQQPVFINQFGQPFLAPAILAPGQPEAQLQPIPPQLLANGQGIAVLAPPHGKHSHHHHHHHHSLPSLNNIPAQLLKAQAQQQQLPLHIVNGAAQIPLIQQGVPQQQRLPIPLMSQQLPNGGQLLSLPPGAPHVLPGQIAILPQGIPQFRGLAGSIIPGNAILGQPHLALLGNPNFPQQLSPTQKGKTILAEKEEQPTRPQEAASQVITASISPSGPSNGPSNKGQGQMTAAIMQSQMEFSEPILQ